MFLNRQLPWLDKDFHFYIWLHIKVDPFSIGFELSKLDAAIQLEQNPTQRELLHLEKALFLLLDETKSQEEKASVFSYHVKGLMNLPSLTEQFKADLRDLETALFFKKGNKKDLISEWTVVDTDYWEDMLLCGTEVMGSCQNINGFEGLNKCLLGYILDGKNRLVAVKDDTGKIVARSIFRILWDKKEKIPVLFQEVIYQAAGAPSSTKAAIEKMALRRSEALGIPLASSYKRYHNPLVSLGSKAPFEYVDSGGGATDGRYQIT